MAIFQGEEMVEVPLPGGGSQMLPRSLAAALQTGQMPAPDQTSYISQGMQPPPSQIAPPPAPEQGPITTIDQVTEAPPEPDMSNAAAPAAAAAGAAEQAVPVQDRARAQQARHVATPRGQLEQGQGAQRTGLQMQAQAAIDSADIEAAQQLLVGEELAKRNAVLDQAFAERQKQADADMRAIEAKTSEFTALRQKYAAAKVDRSVDHPILAMISVALSGIGSAMKGENTVPGLDALYKAIDRKVAAQIQSLEQQGKVLGFQRDEISQLRDSASSRLAMHNLLIAGESEKAARHVEEMTARTSSELIKQRGVALVGQLHERSGIATTEAAKYQMDFDQKDKHHRQSVGVQYAGINQRAREAANRLEFDKGKAAMEFALAQDAARARGGDAAAKALSERQAEVSKRGVKNMATGDYLLKAEGQKLMDEADALDAQAVKLGKAGALTPQMESGLRQKAAVLRTEARTHAAIAHDPTGAKDIASMQSSAQTVTDLTYDIEELYDTAGRSYVETTLMQAKLQAKQSDLLMALKNAWQLGVLSKQDTLLINEATGGDQTKGWDAGNIFHALGLPIGTDPEAFKGRMESLREGTQAAAWDKIVAGTDLPGMDRPAKLFRNREKPQETEITRAVKTIEKDRAPALDEPPSTTSGYVAAQKGRHGSLGDSDMPRVATNQAAALKLLERTARGPDEAKAADARAKLADQAASSHAGVALTAARVLRGIDPALLDGVKMAPEVKEQIDFEDNLAGPVTTPGQDSMLRNIAQKSVMSGTPTIELGRQALVDDAAFDELSRRAASDPQARAALPHVINARQRRK